MTLTIAFFVILLLSAVFHEYMHGWAANEMGDPTAKHLGRLTLNPIPHIDPLMTILMPAALLLLSGGQFMFAAAKPVPFNPYNLKFPKYGPALVGIAGPAGNLVLAIIAALAVRFLPVPEMFATVLAITVYANVLLAVFNLVPIPPLDGSHVLTSLLPPHLDYVARFLQQYGIFLFFIFIAFFSGIVSIPLSFLTGLLLGREGVLLLVNNFFAA